MKKMPLFSLMIFPIYFMKGQVGINTTDPKATFDVVGKPAVPQSLDGIIAPRLTGNELRAKVYTVDQTGALVYVTAPVTVAPGYQTVNVTSSGYYFFDGDRWIKLLAPEPWNVEGTGLPATSNIENIYQMGNVMIGTDEAVNVADATSGSTPEKQKAKLTVSGDASINGVIVGRGGGQYFTNTAVGTAALYRNVTGEYNTALGLFSLNNNTSGMYNVALGSRALQFNTTGTFNIGIGDEALSNNIDGQNNLVFGYTAMKNAQHSRYNMALGDYALEFFNGTPSHQHNIAIGSQAGRHLVSGGGNILIGGYAGGDLTQGDNNLFLGLGSGRNLINGSRNTIIGNHVTVSNPNLTENIIIANSNGMQTINANNFGDVGIGTTDANPITAKLDIFNGNVRIRSINTVSGNNSTDKVVVADANGVLKTTSGMRSSIRVVNNATTLTNDDYTVLYTGTTAATFTLPDPTTCSGRIYHIVSYNNGGNGYNLPGLLSLSPGVMYNDGNVMTTQTNFFRLSNSFVNGGGGTKGQSDTLTIQSDGNYWYAIGL